MKNLALAAVLTLLVGCGVNGSPGTGEKVGQIVKLNKQGMIRETWEAELIRGGMNSGSGSFGTTPFDFTIENDDQAKEIARYLQNQQEVIITYRMEGIYSPFRTDSGGHFLVSVRPATNNVIKPEYDRENRARMDR